MTLEYSSVEDCFLIIIKVLAAIKTLPQAHICLNFLLFVAAHYK